MAQQTIDIGSAPNDGTGDPIRDAFDKCNDNFTELYGSLAGLLDFQGATDCSANPNYPAASQGDIYIVSVAGKIGGASGKDVEVGDFYLAIADNAGGTEASVGTSWAVLQANITGGSVISELDDIPDVNAPTPADGDFLMWDSTPGEWVPGTPAGGVTDLDDLSDVNLTGQTSGDVLTYDGAEWVPQAPSGGDLGALHVQDQKASTTDGGTFTSGAWQTRTLNTSVLNTISGASLSSNQITLDAGTYEVVATAQGFRVNRHQAKLYNVTDAADTFLGTSEFADSGADGSGSVSLVRGRFTIAGTKVFELRHRCETTGTTTGFGVQTAWGTNIYSDVFIRKVS